MIVAIHQPNFFPWLGYFDKICKSDVFVFMDDVQFPMTSRGSWINRVRMLVSEQPRWVTCPVKREKSKMIIKDITIEDDLNWREKIFRTLECNYRKSPHFEECNEVVKEMVLYPEKNLSRYNIRNIKTICNFLDIDASKLTLQSKLHTKEMSTKLLVEIVKKVNGDTYLCGGGSAGYQEDSLFAQEGIRLAYQHFKHPVYDQFNTKDFVKDLSILDCLLNVGIEGTKDLLSTNGHS